MDHDEWVYGYCGCFLHTPQEHGLGLDLVPWLPQVESKRLHKRRTHLRNEVRLTSYGCRLMVVNAWCGHGRVVRVAKPSAGLEMIYWLNSKERKMVQKHRAHACSHTYVSGLEPLILRVESQH